jgi:hypothetical protein
VGNTDEMAQNALKNLKDEVILQNLKKMQAGAKQFDIKTLPLYEALYKKSHRKIRIDFIFSIVECSNTLNLIY